jgi:hypothetical protein
MPFIRATLDQSQVGYPAFPDISILLDISSQTSYAVFCFIKRGLNSAKRP